MTIIRPRLTDFHGIHTAQAQLDFAIPFFDEDIPLYLDPFLLWKSPSLQDNALHDYILSGFNRLGELFTAGKEDIAIQQLVMLSECDEVGLGLSGTRKGKRISQKKAAEILSLFKDIPVYGKDGFSHIEEMQFYVGGISRDRISDIACNLIKSFLIDFTIDQCNDLSLPLSNCEIDNLYDNKAISILNSEKVLLPTNPENKEPIIFVPKRWLRFAPWIDFDHYFKTACPRDEIFNPNEPEDRVRVLNFNRKNYGIIDAFIKERERDATDCLNDPLFSQIPITSAKRKMKTIEKLPTGKTGNADIKYEDAIVQLMSSLLYPHLDFAADQSRTDSGVKIRDLIFYNNREHEFLKEIFTDYDSKQIVMEIKNVKEINIDHINQLNRYMTDSLGKFGVLVTRHEIPKARQKDLIDLWSGQRRCIIALTDADINQMVELFESNQRAPIDVLKKKYIEFQRACPV